MSTSIESHINELTQSLADAKLVQEKFPDVKLGKLPDGRTAFISKQAFSVADRVELLRQGESFPIAVTFVELRATYPRLVVYADHVRLHDIAPTILEKLREVDPKAYQLFIHISKGLV